MLPVTTADVATADECAAALLDALPGVVWFVRRQMRCRRGEGLSVPQFRTLVQLHRCPSASLFSVAEKLGSSLPTVSRIVSGLVAHGLVDRKICAQDRRKVSLRLTVRGEATLEAARAGTQAALASRLADLTIGDRATLARAFALLSALFAGMGQCAGDLCVSPPPAPQPPTELPRPGH